MKPRFGKSAVTALARLGGKSVGIIANNPLHRGGALDADACRKIVDFLVLCDSFNVPLVIQLTDDEKSLCKEQSKWCCRRGAAAGWASRSTRPTCGSARRPATATRSRCGR